VIRFDDLLDAVEVEVSAFDDGIKLDYVIDSAEEAVGLVETIEFPESWSVNELDGLRMCSGLGVAGCYCACMRFLVRLDWWSKPDARADGCGTTSKLEEAH